MPQTLDYSLLARELVHSLRGKRPCSVLSRRAGYRSNVVYRWEQGQAWPHASAFFRFYEVATRTPASGVLDRFFARHVGPHGSHSPTNTGAVAALLRNLSGKTPLIAISRASGINRFTLSRWMKGSAEPRLPELLQLVETLSRRLLDFLAALVDPATLPSISRRWDKLQTARAVAYGEPLSHAVLRALELEQCATSTLPLEETLQRKLGLPIEDIQRCVQALKVAGLVRKRGKRLTPESLHRVDTRADPDGARTIKLAWTEQAVARFRAGAPGAYGFSLFAISRDNLRRLRSLHLEYVRAMQSLIAEPQVNDCVGLYCAQLLDLDCTSDNTFTHDAEIAASGLR